LNGSRGTCLLRPDQAAEPRGFPTLSFKKKQARLRPVPGRVRPGYVGMGEVRLILGLGPTNSFRIYKIFINF